MTSLPAHVHARIAEHVCKDLGVSVEAADVEFILCYVSKDEHEPNERYRFYGYDTYVRQAVVSEGRQYKQHQ